ncbi:hypothetical protein P3S67_030933 [Capsicum chacoense]
MCDVSAAIWKRLLSWIGIVWDPKEWNEEISWIVTYARGSSHKAEVYRMLLAATIYHVRRERNSRVFHSKRHSSVHIIRHIIQEVHVKAAMKHRTAH